MPRHQTAEALHRADIHPAVPGDIRGSVSLSPHGELVAFWSDTTTAVRVTTHIPSTSLLLELPRLDLAHPTAHSMPDGNVLLVGTRTRGSKPNAVLHASDGEVLTRASLGDGIAQVATTSAGDIWVGYFDEGIYGDSELGASGLVHLGPDLRPLWRYPFGSGFGDISDCYALNVTDQAVWTCYYTDFPVVRIKDSRLTGWHNEINGANALIVAGPHVGLFGTYEDHVLLTVGMLDADSLHIVDHYRVTLPGGAPLPDKTHVIGQGSELHIVTPDSWYCLDLTDITN